MSNSRKSSGKQPQRKRADRSAISTKSTPKSQRRIRARAKTILEEDEYENDYLPLKKLLLSLILGGLLLYPSAAITLMIVEQIKTNDLLWNLRGNLLSSFFALGGGLALILLAIRFTRELLLPLYVYGHELTHAIFVFVCYGKVTAFKASADGGYIIANRANILVSLSPYIFPFWTIFFGLIHGIGSIFTDLTTFSPYFFLMYGATWFFNLFWTIWMIPLGQSDLSSNGTFLSLTLIFITNTLGLSLIIEFTRAQPSIESWFFELINTHATLFHSLFAFFPSI